MTSSKDQTPQAKLAEILDAPEIEKWDDALLLLKINRERLSEFRKEVNYMALTDDGWENLEYLLDDKQRDQSVDEYVRVRHLVPLAQQVKFGKWAWDDPAITSSIIDENAVHLFLHTILGMTAAQFNQHMANVLMRHGKSGNAFDYIRRNAVATYLDLYIRTQVDPDRVVNKAAYIFIKGQVWHASGRTCARDIITMHTTVREAFELCVEYDLFENILNFC